MSELYLYLLFIPFCECFDRIHMIHMIRMHQYLHS